MAASSQPRVPTYAVAFRDGGYRLHGEGAPVFTLLMPDSNYLERFLRADLYSTAMDFIRGRFDACGDFIAAVAFKLTQSTSDAGRWLAALASSLEWERWFQSRARAARNIRFHYDRSNEFYRQFLDSQMIYSCAYFRDPGCSLEDAQLAKLDLICRKLDLKAGERFLDVGCGWGGLILHAAERYQAVSTGCTLSRRQSQLAAELASERRLPVTVCDADYRDLSGRFDKIASVGMFEHVGRHRLNGYFRKIYDLLEPEGLFLNHGISRPEGLPDGHETWFLRQKVFPGGELATLGAALQRAEEAGFESIDVENLRPHYALTCRHWVARLKQNAEACLRLVDAETYRTWLLYLAASALSFENGATAVYQVLFAKRSGRRRRMTRDYLLTPQPLC